MSEVIYYIAMALFLSGAIGYGAYLSKMLKNNLRITENQLIKKKTLVLVGFWGLITLGLILFTVAFYLDPSTVGYLKEENIIVNVGHQFMSYFFLILMAAFAFTFLTSFFYYFWFTNFDEKFRKYMKWIMYGSIPLVVISFILMSEGNAPYLQYPLCNSIYIGKHGIKFINSYVKPEPFYAKNESGYLALDGGISIAFYAIFILSGAFLVLGICDHYIYKIYGKHDIVTTCFFVAFPFGLIGARLWYVLLDISKNGNSSIFIRDWTKIFAVQDGGLGIMGGAILGIIAGVSVMLIIKYWKKDPNYQHMSYLRLVDIIVPAILVAQAIGRIGNFFNAEVHGNEIPMSSIAWLPTFVKLNYQFDGSHFIGDATQAYLPLATIETITNLIGYFFIYFGITRSLGKYHAEGSGLGWYLVWYGATRAFLEPLRYGSYQYDMSVKSSYYMIGVGFAIITFFVIWKILREKHLWMYKDHEYIDAVIVKDERTDKTLIRNAIILGSLAILMAIMITVFFTIW